MQKKKGVLIITYYWPPSAGSGVQRWLKFAKYLPEYGWNPVIFTPENPDFDLKDYSLLNEIPVELEVLKLPIWEPYGLFRKAKKSKVKNPSTILEQGEKSLFDKLAIWIRANLIIPDPRVFWVRPATGFLGAFLRDRGITTVITTGPPHSMHLIGLALKRRYGIKWLADFRDPWSSWEFLEKLPITPIVLSRHKKLEQNVLKAADHIITISPTFQQDLFELSGRKVHLITNGFDSNDLPVDFYSENVDLSIFHVVYIGIIDSIRNPDPFLNAFKRAFQTSVQKVKLTFVGKISVGLEEKVSEDPWLKSHVQLTGYVSHQEVFAYYKNASALLLILTQTKNAKGNIPGKLFEYLATGRPIVAMGDPEGDSAQIIREANAGKVFKHSEEKEIEAFLLDLQLKNKPNPKASLKQYERKNLTSKLADLLDEN
ncbi:glycosyltransferase family 4 protein [Pararhodonellum marinum]|uniref:glycosyltransferase family 4 protein n=1 Tax=Pararhodonellum marinum TaxID=2755358 RepID=UPI001890AE40|nr:glycosyltransferase family 4 protein [Pararhodonellum marinum]